MAKCPNCGHPDGGDDPRPKNHFSSCAAQNPLAGMSRAERNVAKLRAEWIKLGRGMVPHWNRFKQFRWGDISHAYINLYTESRKLSPYLIGHIDAIKDPLALLTIATLAGLLIWKW